MRISRRVAWLRLAFPACAVLAVMLGGYGFYSCGTSSHTDGLRIYDAALQTAQLFVLGVSPDDLCNWFARVAAILAPAAGIGAAVVLLWQRLKRRWRWLTLPWWPADVIFLGGGATAASIALRLYGASDQRAAQTGGTPRSAHKVIALDSEPASPLAQVLDQLDCGEAFEWRGDALSAGVLRDVNAAEARKIWVLTGDNLRNIEIARRLIELRQSAGAGKTRLEARSPWLLVNVHDQRLLRAHRSAHSDSSDHSVLFFDMPRIAARQLMRVHPPAIPPVTPSALPERVLHVAVVGDGELAEAIVEHAILHLVYSDRPDFCLRLSLVGPSAQAMHQRLLERLPALDSAHGNEPSLAPLMPLANISVHQCDASTWMPGDWERLQSDAPFAAVYVTHDTDLLTIAVALRAAALRDAKPSSRPQPIVACLRQGSHEPGAATSSSSEKLRLPQIEGFATFSIYEASLDPDELYPGEAADRRAMLVNLVYQQPGVALDTALGDKCMTEAKDRWFGNPGTPSTAEEFRWSSRLAADHIDVKLACLGSSEPALMNDAWLDAVAKSGRGANPQQDTGWLMKLEHRRFVVERLLRAWLPIDDSGGVDKTRPSGFDEAAKKTVLRLNRTLVAFDALDGLRPDPSRRLQSDKDRRIVDATPHIIRRTPR